MTNRKEYMKKYQQEHKEAFRIATQKYRDKDRKKYNEHSREYRKRKYKEAKENAELVIKQKEILDKIKEYIENLLKEELEITDPDSTMFGEKCQRKFFSDSELEKILELLEEIE